MKVTRREVVAALFMGIFGSIARERMTKAIQRAQPQGVEHMRLKLEVVK